ncbi:MAG: hypothetical protein IK098_10875 [Bacteroidales bacterium]|nr:hypothetical protein [Bacteroidales bacterium]
MRRILLLCASFLLMLAGSADAREFLVAKTGSDSNDGSTAAEGEEVWIKGSEEVKGWTREKKTDVWKVVLPNSFFGDFNPFAEPLRGDWLNVFKEAYSLGEVYLNGQSLFQMESLDEVRNPVVQKGTRKPEASLLQWYAEVSDTETTLWANFGGADPNKELVEVNARPAVFFPELPGVNFITVKGFHLSQAAVNWAPPTAFQPGLVGPHWSKGWIIEDNVISNSKCSGISLGKDRAGNARSLERSSVGPFENIRPGQNEFVIWKF